MTRIVDTFKDGPFAFSDVIDQQKLVELTIGAMILYQTVNDLPILPSISSRLDEELIARAIFGTAAIEGNPLKEDEVKRILSAPEEGATTEKVKKEILNLKEAYHFIHRNVAVAANPLEFTEDLVRQVHQGVTQGIDYNNNIPGQYRNTPVKVGNEEHGGVYAPPKVLDDVRTLMREYVTWINAPEVVAKGPFIRAALAHLHFSLIHPFADGNGRTARLLEAMILHSAGIRFVPVMMSNFYYRNVDDYYWAFSNSIKAKDHDVTPFIAFMLKGVNDSLREIKERITWFIRKFTLRDYFAFQRKNRAISGRQHDLLTLLLDHVGSFTSDDLFTKAPFLVLYRTVQPRTAARDLKKLTEGRYLVLTDRNYQLNLKMLG